MPFGPGKYDHLASMVRRKTMASQVVLIVVGGNKGAGFSVQSAAHGLEDHARQTLALSQMLRQVADQMDIDAKRILAGMSVQDVEAAERAEAHPDASRDPDES